MKERVELSCITNMSVSKGVSNAKKLVETAKAYNMDAIAITDNLSVGSFPLAAETVRGTDFKVIYGMQLPTVNDYYDIPIKTDLNVCFRMDNITVLAKNQEGIKSIYKILTDVNLLGEYSCALNTEKLLKKHRENILVGSGTTMIPRLIREGASDEDLIKTAEFFDYLEIACEEEELETRKIIEIGSAVEKPVVVVGNICFADKSDEELFEILAPDFKSYHYSKHPLLTTEEMLDKFSYLPEDVARKIVVDNTNLIADMIFNNLEPICLTFTYSEEDKYFEEIKETALKKMSEIYGPDVPIEIADRVNKELSYISNPGNALNFYASMKMCEDARSKNIAYTIRGTVGNSLVAYLTGISNINPIEYNLYPEVFFGRTGEKMIDIDLNFPSIRCQEYYQHKLNNILKTNDIYYPGAVPTISLKASNDYVDNYCDIMKITPTAEEREKLIERFYNACIRRSSGMHPGAKIVIPNGYSVFDFTPLESQNGKLKTHYDFHHFWNIGIAKIDILGHSALDLLMKLKEKTNVNISEIPLNDVKVMELFKNVDTIGVHEFGTDFVRTILKLCKPNTFDDLVKISGLSHGTDVWNNNAEILIKDNVCELSDIMTTRDDVMDYLIKHGADEETAFKASEIVRKGLAAKREESRQFIRGLQSEYDLPDWWIESVCKVRYMFPKSHAISYVQLAVRIAYFKVYFPEIFYKTYLEVYKDDEDLIQKISEEIKSRGICLR